MIRYFVYNLVLTLLSPLAALYLLARPKYRGLLKRFWPSAPIFPRGTVIWVHACSVGEVFVAKALIESMASTFPEFNVVLTVNTISGFGLAREEVKKAYVTYAPFDLPWCVRRFARKTSPELLILVETEIWPNLVRETRKSGTKVIIVNGRISPQQYPVYQRYHWILPPVLDWLSVVLVQNSTYQERFCALGLDKVKVRITGNIKFDGVNTEMSDARKQELRREMGIDNSSQVLIFGCTRPGDEELAADCWNQLKDDYPNLRLIIAPRHLERLNAAITCFETEKISLRTEAADVLTNAGTRILFLNTLGELASVYGIGTVAVVGGSCFPGVEGHNPLESAGLGVATIFGPYMGNFPEAARLLVEAGGAVQISKNSELVVLIKKILDDPEYGARVSELGRTAILNNQGALDKTVEIIAGLLNK